MKKVKIDNKVIYLASQEMEEEQQINIFYDLDHTKEFVLLSLDGKFENFGIGSKYLLKSQDYKIDGDDDNCVVIIEDIDSLSLLREEE